MTAPECIDPQRSGSGHVRRWCRVAPTRGPFEGCVGLIRRSDRSSEARPRRGAHRRGRSVGGCASRAVWPIRNRASVPSCVSPRRRCRPSRNAHTPGDAPPSAVAARLAARRAGHRIGTHSVATRSVRRPSRRYRRARPLIDGWAVTRGRSSSGVAV